MANNADYINDIQQLLPTVFIEQVILEPNSISPEKKFSSLRATMSLKDVVEKDGVSQWFAEQDLQKFMTLNVFVFKSESLYNSVLNFTSQNENYSFFEINSIAQQNKKEIFTYTFKLPTKEELEQQKGAFYSENYITENSDGTKELTIPIKTDFRLLFDDENDTYIAIIAFMTFNLNEFALQFNITDILETNALSKSLTPMVVIKDGAVVSQFQYFILPDGQFYYGQYHINNNPDGTKVYRTGTVETEKSQTLQLVTDTQNIVLDTRARRIFAEKSIIDETGILNNFVKTNLQIEKIIKKSKPNSYSKYFSEPIVSLDEQGNSRLSFFFDKQKFILENSFYPTVLEKNPILIPQKARVKNISVYRIRKDIKEINYNSENISYLVASNKTSNNVFDVLGQPDLEKYNGSYIVENNVESVNPAIIKSYSAYDSSISDINYGLYKYKVGIEIIDPTKQYLLDMLNILSTASSKLQEYYNASISNKRELTEQDIGDVKQTKAKFTPYFDNLLGKFIPNFLKDNLVKAQQAQIALVAFLYAAKEFGYYSFNNTAEETQFILSMNNFLIPPTASPDTILLVIKIVEEFISKLKFVLDVPNTESKSSPSGKNNSLYFEYILEPSSVESISNTTEYNINTSYENYFNSAVMNGIGYKIIKNFNNDLSGINSINLLEYKNIADEVSQKHFNDYTSLNIKELYGEIIPDVYNFIDDFNDNDSKYCYLPVSSVTTMGNKYNFGLLTDQILDQNFFESMFLDIINYNTLKQTNFNTQDIPQNSSLKKEELIIKGQLLDLFGFSGFSNISIASEQPVTSFEKNQKNSLYNIFGKSGEPSRNVIDQQISNNKNTSKASTSDLNQNPSSLLIEILLREIVGSVEQLKLVRDFSIFCPVNEEKENNPDFFLNKISTAAFLLSFIPGSEDYKITVQNYIRNLPIPIKHLIISRANVLKVSTVFNDENFEKDASKYPENFFKYWINFKNLYEIQYFDGFDKNNVKSPIWKTLTINKLNSSKSRILCRIQKFKLPSFEEYFPDIAKLEMPIFDKYFYIIPDESVDLLVSIEKEVQLVPKIELPPVQKENPPPDKAGPISFISSMVDFVQPQMAPMIMPEIGAKTTTKAKTISSNAVNTKSYKFSK